MRRVDDRISDEEPQLERSVAAHRRGPRLPISIGAGAPA
jgi:hypothetical protein